MKLFKNILCVLEDKATASTVLRQVAALTSTQQANLTLLAVVETPPQGLMRLREANAARNVLDAMQAEKRDQLESWRDQYLGDDGDVRIEVAEGKRFLAVIKQVLRDSHDLVVKCKAENNWDADRPDADDMHLLRKCPCPVLLLRSDAPPLFREVMASVDVNDSDEDSQDSCRVQRELNQQVLDYAAVMAASDDAALHVASVWEAYGEHFLRYGIFAQTPEAQIEAYVEKSRRESMARLDALFDDMRERMGDDVMAYLDPRRHVVKGVAHEQIVRLVAEYGVDLLVMGTVARTGIAGLIIGNTAEEILTRVACSVLAIKPQGFVSPVTV